jgi:hypothetical protein
MLEPTLSSAQAAPIMPLQLCKCRATNAKHFAPHAANLEILPRYLTSACIALEQPQLCLNLVECNLLTAWLNAMDGRTRNELILVALIAIIVQTVTKHPAYWIAPG